MRFKSTVNVYPGKFQDYGFSEVSVDELHNLGFAEVDSVSYNSTDGGIQITVVQNADEGLVAIHRTEKMAKCCLAKPNGRFDIVGVVQV